MMRDVEVRTADGRRCRPPAPPSPTSLYPPNRNTLQLAPTYQNVAHNRCILTVVSADVVDRVETSSARDVAETVTLRRQTAHRVDVIEADARGRHGNRQVRQHRQHLQQATHHPPPACTNTILRHYHRRHQHQHQHHRLCRRRHHMLTG